MPKRRLASNHKDIHNYFLRRFNKTAAVPAASALVGALDAARMSEAQS